MRNHFYFLIFHKFFKKIKSSFVSSVKREFSLEYHFFGILRFFILNFFLFSIEIQCWVFVVILFFLI